VFPAEAQTTDVDGKRLHKTVEDLAGTAAHELLDKGEPVKVAPQPGDRDADQRQGGGVVRRPAWRDRREHPGHRAFRRLLGSGGGQRLWRGRDARPGGVLLEDRRT